MCVALMFSVSCVTFINSLIDFYFIMVVVAIIGIFMAIRHILNYTFRLPVLNNSGSANARPLDVSSLEHSL